MNDMSKQMVFADFAKKALEKINERKKFKRAVMHVEDIGMDLELRGLSDQELEECMSHSDDDHENDKYTLYFASKTLQELAAYMKANGQIKNELDITDMFTLIDRKELVKKVLDLSGINDKTTVSEVDELKNDSGAAKEPTCMGMPLLMAQTPVQ